MTQVNNNAESLSRELRKFKNLKSVDFKGLLSGTPESYVNLYRYLFCENNIGFSQLVLDKGYDLSGLNDYKFMESVYKMMRDFLNTKPPINQNQFFSPGFTQRKLEMSTIIASEVRKITNDLQNKNNKKSVQTPSLMKLSLKRPSSAPKDTRVIEMGDESESMRHKVPFEKYKKPKSTKKYNDKKLSDKSKRQLKYQHNSQSSDGLSDESDEVDSYNSQVKTRDENAANSYKPSVERSDTAQSYNPVFRTNEQLSTNTADNRSKSFMEARNFSSTYNYQKPLELGEISAFENGHGNIATFNSRGNHQERLYDVKQYVPSIHKEPVLSEAEQRVPGLERIMQQFDTVLARITLLEGRMNRMESKLDNNNIVIGDRPLQGNFNNSEYISSYEHNRDSKRDFYGNKNAPVIQTAKDSIPDFESNYDPVRSKMDSDRSYTSSTYSTNYKPHVPLDNNNYSAPRYVTKFTNYSDKRVHEPLNGTSSDYFNYNPSSSHQLTHSIASKIDHHYQPLSSTYKASQSQPPQKPSNGIPPVHPPLRQPNKHSDDKVVSQTDRIASMLSDTQKMLRLSDEEL